MILSKTCNALCKSSVFIRVINWLSSYNNVLSMVPVLMVSSVCITNCYSLIKSSTYFLNESRQYTKLFSQLLCSSHAVRYVLVWTVFFYMAPYKFQKTAITCLETLSSFKTLQCQFVSLDPIKGFLIAVNGKCVYKFKFKWFLNHFLWNEKLLKQNLTC